MCWDAWWPIRFATRPCVDVEKRNVTPVNPLTAPPRSRTHTGNGAIAPNRCAGREDYRKYLRIKNHHSELCHTTNMNHPIHVCRMANVMLRCTLRNASSFPSACVDSDLSIISITISAHIDKFPGYTIVRSVEDCHINLRTSQYRHIIRSAVSRDIFVRCQALAYS